MEPKWIFGITAVGVLGVIQCFAFVLGIDGQVFTATIGLITAIVGFLLGLNLPSPAEKKAFSEALTMIINQNTQNK